jgi:hypothetical protein
LFKTLIALEDDGGSPLTGQRFLFLKYAVRNRDSDITVSVCPLRYFVVLPFMQHVLAWTTMMQAQMGPALTVLASRGKPATETADKTVAKVAPDNARADAEEATAPPRMKCQVWLKRIELVMPEKVNSQSSRALAVRASFHVEYAAQGPEQEVQLEMLEVKVSKTKVFADIETPLMEPWSAAVSYRDTVGVMTRIDVVLAPMDLVFAHSDYVLAMALLAPLNERRSPLACSRFSVFALTGQERNSGQQSRLDQDLQQHVARQVVVEPRRMLHHYFGQSLLLDSLLAADTIRLQADPSFSVHALEPESRDMGHVLYIVVVYSDHGNVHLAEVSHLARTEADMRFMRWGPKANWPWSSFECRLLHNGVLDFVAVRAVCVSMSSFDSLHLICAALDELSMCRGVFL